MGLKQQIQEYNLCQWQHHLVLICPHKRFLGGANFTSPSSLSHLVFIFCVIIRVRSFLNFSHGFFLLKQVSFLRIQLEGWGVKISLPYGNQCLRNHIQELIALSSVNLTGKIEINAMLVSQSKLIPLSSINLFQY